MLLWAVFIERFDRIANSAEHLEERIVAKQTAYINHIKANIYYMNHSAYRIDPFLISLIYMLAVISVHMMPNA